MQPQPTPYDITALPVFAYSPGLFEWLLVLGLLVLLGLLAYLFMRLRAPKSIPSPIAVALSEIASMRAQQALPGKEVLARASLLLKRLGEHLGAGPLPQMTPLELQRALEGLDRPDLSKLITEAAELDNLRFAPQLSSEEARARLQRIEELVITLRHAEPGRSS